VGRRVATFLVACLVVPALALAAEGEPKKRIVAADQKKAAAIVLKRTDLAAGWRRVRTPGADEPLTCPGYNPDQSDLTLTGESLTEFAHGAGLPVLASSSAVYVSTKDALASWTRTIKPALVRCYADSFRETIAAQGGKATIVKQGRMAFPRLAPRTAAYRITARVVFTEGGQATTVPFVIHVIAFGRGRGDVALVAGGPGAGIPAASLRTFARLLASRLQASGV
jgi:hypothetical protein